MKKTVFDFRNIRIHRKALMFFLMMVDTLTFFKISYFLEGGTLLGLVRDKNLLPWDHDIDFSIKSTELEKVKKLKWYLIFNGFKLSIRRSKINIGPFKKGDIIAMKVKPILPYIVKEWFFLKNREHVVCDIFVKKTDGKHYYWQAKEKIMRVSCRYHDQYERIDYLGRDIMVPSNYEDYLSEKYGDWLVPVKEWDCARDEMTIVDLVE